MAKTPKEKDPPTAADPPQTKAAQRDATLAQIRKHFGEAAILPLGAHLRAQVEVIPTRITQFDIATGVGGIPRGRILEIFGPESGGKTTLCLQFIAEVQKQNGLAAFIDAEHALDTAWARKLGVRTEDLLISQPNNGEEALTIAEMLIKGNFIDIIVIDSVAALVPKAELEGDMGMATMGMQARLMSQALRKLSGAISKSRTICIFTNQLREKVGVMFGSPETTPGGKALKFWASMRIRVSSSSDLTKDKDDRPIAKPSKSKIIKNKVAPPYGEAEALLFFDRGFDVNHNLISAAIEHNVIEKKGAWLQFAGELLGHGHQAATEAVAKNKELWQKVRVAVEEVTIRKNQIIPQTQETDSEQETDPEAERPDSAPNSG
jgi:recombination protein RecA